MKRSVLASVAPIRSAAMLFTRSTLEAEVVGMGGFRTSVKVRDATLLATESVDEEAERRDEASSWPMKPAAPVMRMLRGSSEDAISKKLLIFSRADSNKSSCTGSSPSKIWQSYPLPGPPAPHR